MEMNTRRCRNCRFWNERVNVGRIAMGDEPAIGPCRRMPPQTDGHLSFFPETKEGEWCGEWKRRKEHDNR